MRIVHHPVNLGQGAAIQTGVEYARAIPWERYFVTFDADGQHRVEDVEAMVGRRRILGVDRRGAASARAALGCRSRCRGDGSSDGHRRE